MSAGAIRGALLGGLLALGGACTGGDDTAEPAGAGAPDKGDTRFVSADGFVGQEAQAGGDAAANDAAPGTSPAAPGQAAEGAAMRSADATVVEGDIYRVLDSGTILNLNRYRGLQVIDISDLERPQIIGAYSVQGEPVEMYVRGDTALVLLNDWTGYYGSRDDIDVEQREGGLLLSIDLGKRTAPSLNDSVFIRGHVQKSRLVSDGDAAAVYIASSGSEEREVDGYYEWVSRTVITSFDVSGEELTRRDELDLGGYVQDIQATPNAMLVATNDWSRGNGDRNEVAIVDISHPDGSMTMGDSVVVAGYVQSQFNMDLYEGVLRVVSTDWSRDTSNVLETFDASDLTSLTALDRCEFGAGMDLYATLFMGEKAFFVTYFRQDPFHAFAIGADGSCEERSEFVVSGWNDFFRPVFGGTRLIGIGQNDEDGGSTPAVSLYDITDLDNPTPLLSRAQAGELRWSWSEANYDHRAFSVLEGAVSVPSADGVEETGLVLLPFGGWTEDEDGGRHMNGVRIYTFSDTTVTARGAMQHDSEVRRSFLAGDELTANLSEASLALFDHSDPDAPEALGKVDLAPDFGKVLAFGDYLARLHRPAYEYYYEIEAGREAPSARVEIIPDDGDPNTTEVVAAFDVPVDARLLKAGDALLAISYRYRECGDWPCPYDTSVRVFDLGDPTDPRAAGTAEADDLSPSYVGFGGDPYYGGGGFIGCGVGNYWFSGNQVDGTFALGDSVVFTVGQEHEKLVGQERVCQTYPAEHCEANAEGVCDTYYEGAETCTSLDGAAEVCRGQIYVCEYTNPGGCEPVALADVETRRECWNNERRRYWQSYDFKVLDISDLDEPRFGELIEMPDDEEAVRVLPSGDSIFYTYKQPATVEDDARPHVAYYFKELGFKNPEAPGVGASVNIPGELIAVEDGRLYTRDLRWGEEVAETYLHELVRDGAVARLEASHRFPGRDVQKLVVDGERLLVSHRPLTGGYGYYGDGVVFFDAAPVPGGSSRAQEEPVDQLTIFSLKGLSELGELDIDRWSTLEAAHSGKALYTVSGGMLLFNLADPKAPFAQAYFPSNGWPEQILFDGDTITIAAGRYGIHHFDADVFNLLSD